MTTSQVNKHVVDLEAAKARLRVVEKHAASASRGGSAHAQQQPPPQVKPPRNLPATNSVAASDGGRGSAAAAGGNLKLGVGEDNYVKYNNSNNGNGRSENRCVVVLDGRCAGWTHRIRAENAADLMQNRKC